MPIRSRLSWHQLYRPLADEWHLFFNGGDSFETVASGDAESMIVYDESRLRLFMHREDPTP